METTILILAVYLMAFTFQTHAQVADNTIIGKHTVDANALLLKSKQQKNAAWVLLGGGAGVAIAGLSIISSDASKDLSNDLITIFSFGYITPQEHKHTAAGPILAIAGTGAMLGSIPLFISASKNKRKARLIIKDVPAFFNPQLNIKEHFLSLGLKINL